MNWQKVLLVLGGLVLAFVLMVTVALGFAAAAGAAGIATVAESGILDNISVTVDEVAGDADQVRVQVDVPEITVTETEHGRARITAQSEGGRLEFNVDGPEVSVTDLESGEVRWISPRIDGRLNRFELDGLEFHARDHVVVWPHNVFSPLLFLVRVFFALVAIGLITAGVIVLRRNRQAAPKNEKVA